MILSVTVSSRINPDLNISHRAEIVVDDDVEARAAGGTFWGMIVAFNEGIAAKAEEISDD